MEHLISLVVAVLLIEAYAWLPTISEWLIEWAVRRLPVEEQQRCSEEWKANSAALPNSGLKLVHALSICRAVGQINADIIEANFNELDCKLRNLSDQQDRNMQARHTLNIRYSEVQEQRRHLELQGAAAVAYAKLVASPRADVPNDIEAFVKQRIVVITRAEDLLKGRIETINADGGRLDSVVKTVVEKYTHTLERFRKRKFSARTLARALDNLHEELNKLPAVLNLEPLGDWQDAAEFEKTIAAIHELNVRVSSTQDR